MADYLAPFHMPKFSDDEYLEKKAEYVRENGYTITFPNIGNVIHLGINKPMTGAEKILWATGRRNEIGASRLTALYAQKERSRSNYKRMLASPIPNWASSYISILTAMDDFQDAVISLAALGRIACKFLPKFLARGLLGPIGWLWLISEVMAMLMAPAACALNPLSCKRKMKKDLKRRAKGLKAGRKGYAKSGGFLPSWVEGIQMLQTTDQVYGIGISIGPLFGIAYDLMFGGVRWLQGKDVSFARAPTDIEIFRKATDTKHAYARWTRPKTEMSQAEFQTWKAKKVASGTWGVRSQQDDAVQKAIRLHTTYGGVIRKTDYLEETILFCGAELAGQGAKNILDHWNPMENVTGLEHIEIEAYHEWNPLLEEMLIEEGEDPEGGIAWPSLGKRWATYDEIQASTAPIAAENFRHFVDTCPDERLKIIGEQSAIEGGLHSIAMLEGQENIQIQYHAAITIAETLLDNRFTFPRTVTQQQIERLATYMQDHEDLDTRPGLKEILDYVKNSLGFEFVTKI